MSDIHDRTPAERLARLNETAADTHPSAAVSEPAHDGIDRRTVPRRSPISSASDQ
jgi:hypothetical protein